MELRRKTKKRPSSRRIKRKKNPALRRTKRRKKQAWYKKGRSLKNHMGMYLQMSDMRKLSTKAEQK